MDSGTQKYIDSQIEKAKRVLGNIFKDKKIKNEWFKLDTMDLDEIKKICKEHG